MWRLRELNAWASDGFFLCHIWIYFSRSNLVNLKLNYSLQLYVFFFKKNYKMANVIDTPYKTEVTYLLSDCKCKQKIMTVDRVFVETVLVLLYSIFYM